MQRNQGFTLIELMIVVAIIAIIAAIAIPSLLQARISGNEASAISSLRTLSTVNEQYRTRFGGFAPTLADLNTAGYIDEVLSAGSKSGYTFAYGVGIGTPTWNCVGTPQAQNGTGVRGFRVDESGVIRFSSNGVDPGAAGTVLQ